MQANLPMSNSRRCHESADFTCIRCKMMIPGSSHGTKHRNHCPMCLWSRHVDERTGDRRSACRQPMRPVAVEVKGTGEWSIIHRCCGCEMLRANRVAGDDAELALLALALRAVQAAPFPLEAYLRE